jgi:hypothetical protein
MPVVFLNVPPETSYNPASYANTLKRLAGLEKRRSCSPSKPSKLWHLRKTAGPHYNAGDSIKLEKLVFERTSNRWYLTVHLLVEFPS